MRAGFNPPEETLRAQPVDAFHMALLSNAQRFMARSSRTIASTRLTGSLPP
jgi:hypothetical protein